MCPIFTSLQQLYIICHPYSNFVANLTMSILAFLTLHHEIHLWGRYYVLHSLASLLIWNISVVFLCFKTLTRLKHLALLSPFPLHSFVFIFSFFTLGYAFLATDAAVSLSRFYTQCATGPNVG